MKVPAIVLGLALLAPAWPALQRRVDPDAFSLGVLRRDGYVLPFAAYDGKIWSSPWPALTPVPELPISLDAVPVSWWGKAGRPAEMTIWSGGQARGVVRPQAFVVQTNAVGRRGRGRAPVAVSFNCSAPFWVRTDYRPADVVIPPPQEQPYPKDGLAVWGSQSIDPIEAVPRTSPAWADISMAVLEPLNDAEQLAVGFIRDWKHPVPRSVRPTVRLEVEALYRAPVDADGWTAHYVEAVRKYRPGPEDNGCGLVTFASGWIMTGPKGKQWSSISARIAYCDRKGFSYFFPLGLITRGEHTYWVYQASGYDQEHYVVTETTRRRAEHVAVFVARRNCELP